MSHHFSFFLIFRSLFLSFTHPPWGKWSRAYCECYTYCYTLLLSVSMFKIEKKSNMKLLYFSIVPINSVIQFIHFNQNKQNKSIQNQNKINVNSLFSSLCTSSITNLNLLDLLKVWKNHLQKVQGVKKGVMSTHMSNGAEYSNFERSLPWLWHAFMEAAILLLES